jgi:hypothetical protein
MGCGMSDNQNTEINQPTDELNDEQLNEVAGGGGLQQGLLLPYIEQDNVYKAAGGQTQASKDLPMESISFNYSKID